MVAFSSGLHVSRASNDFVYGLENVKGTVNRNIAKVDVAGTVVTSGKYDMKRTAYKYEDINHLPPIQ